MSTYDLIAGLPVRIEGYELQGHRQQINPEFERRTTTIHLHGGEEGVGEDVVYSGDDHEHFQNGGGDLDLRGDWTIDSFSEHLAKLDPFPVAPEREDSRPYRTWAFESAALDLALRQAGRALHDVVGRDPRPLTFVNSMGLGDPPDLRRVHDRLGQYPALRLKLDARSSWTEAHIAELAATGAIDSIDLKGQYSGTIVDQPADPELYRRVVEGFPDAWIEDPKLTDATRPILDPHRDRITWDAIIHTTADVDALPFVPKTINVKPSRSGPLRELFALYDLCDERGIDAYGGGQTELSIGRDHIQLLAAIFHPGTANDVAPRGYNATQLAHELPSSPLKLSVAPTGFRLLGAP